MAHKFVELPEKGKKVYLHRFNASKNKMVKVRQVLWGDWLTIDENHDYDEVGTEWLAVKWAPRSANPQILYILKKHTTDSRPLEIIFLDVAQGDGAVLISPERNDEERIMIIDAGEGDNMKRFLSSRFKTYRGFNFDSAIITHPDLDHYLGFEEIFADTRIGFNNIYHNGIVERPVSGKFEKVGGLVTDSVTGKDYITDLPENRNDIETLFGNSVDIGSYKFPSLMRYALNNQKIKDFKILSTDSAHSVSEDGRNYLPEFAPSDNRLYTIEVLGPLMERDSNNSLRLQKISSNYGKTKNGHSILLRLHIGGFKVFFGGDLNKIAEKFLLKHYTGRKYFPKKNSDASKQMIEEAKHWFEADIMKVCHHGASDVTDEFMLTVNPACFVISSGDSEGHVHPRPDLLGRLGKMGRGDSPVLLSTELQRSSREKEDAKLIVQLKKNIDKQINKFNAKRKQKIEEQLNELSKTNVDVYGAIYLKTDGKRLITAFKIEEKSDKKKWFYFEYSIDSSGNLIRV